ncbi:Chromodomain-helicase-DNA-binding protein 8 [Larimichthys crocea]|uniref:Chromodomain-helicase-DNA-binding protein 8 n=1 Tax=Larimichthys crocea TaxID=215358 RepID=A0A6G0IIW8_LARCR|nr:Chromodomain-helicase-DNA-binding protein 8 [Larimichthys crocea]
MADPIMDLFEDTPLFNLDAIPDDSFSQGSSDPVEEALKLALGQVDPPAEPELTVNAGLNVPVAAPTIPDPVPVQVPTQQQLPVVTAQTVSIAAAPAVAPAPVDTVPQIQAQTTIPIVSNTSVATSSTVLLSSPLTVSSSPVTTTATTQLTQIITSSLHSRGTVLNQASPGQAQVKVGAAGVQRLLQSPNGPVKQMLLTSMPQHTQGQTLQQKVEGTAFTLYELFHSGCFEAITPAKEHKSMSPNIRTKKIHVLFDRAQVNLGESNGSGDHQDDGVRPWSTERNSSCYFLLYDLWSVFEEATPQPTRSVYKPDHPSTHLALSHLTLVILQTLLRKAEEKLKDGERILKEHDNIDSLMDDSLKQDDTQVGRLGSDLQVQVKKLVAALREITTRERQQVIERVHEDCSKVREEMSQMLSIQHYLASLLAETDPFLLIWAFQSDDTKLLADLNSPLFIPDTVSLDRKHILEDIESKYREFITATLRCLSELKRELLTSPLTLDTNTAHPLLSISDDLRLVTRVKNRLPCAAHPERFDHWPQVLAIQTFSSGTHYWEVEAEGFWDIAVCYRNIGRKGKEGNAFGNNKVSWSLTQQHDKKLAAWHNRRKTRLTYQMTGTRVAVAVDYGAGTITFSEVGPSGNLTHLHTFSTTFTEPVCLGFGLYKAELNSRISIVTV